ncbi:MAG TPA: hypothetical protein VHM26_02270, partial [Chitinophagaceae bacterium]|nr:hypothetical protein [Chitinophagaceae bacterium]
MYNFYTHIATNPDRCRHFACGESLLTMFQCGLETKYADLWSHYNYIVYVIEGRKIWHTATGSFELNQGDCVFIQKGSAIVEQFFDADFCLFLFFIPDDFICDVLKRKSKPITQPGVAFGQVINIERNLSVEVFFQSMRSYFEANVEPDKSL